MSKRKGRKRANGDGTIVRKKNGKYAGAVTLGHDVNGKQVRRYFTAAAREEAEAIRQRLIRERDAGTSLEAHKTTVGEFLRRWLEHKERHVRPVTHQGYEYIVRRMLEPRLASVRLTDLRALKVEALVGEMLAEGFSARMVRGALGTLKTALKQAVVWQILTSNPAEHVRAPALSRVEMKAWTADETRRFLDAAKCHKLYPLFYLALATGMRRGELLGLHWKEVDLEEGWLRVSRSLVKVRGGVQLGEPKTRASRRTLLLSADTVRVLRDHQLDQEIKLGKLATMVFASSEETHLWPRNVQRRFDALIERASVSKIRLHDLRHTAASLLIRHGVPVKVVAERLGHADPSITLRTYAHMYEEQRRAGAVSLEEVLT
ncbi:MAG: tyrosine-type recombinase/integrase [Trueperaceae bacterium]